MVVLGTPGSHKHEVGFPSPSYCFLGEEMGSELLTAHLRVAGMRW